ncbi:MAG: ankyrin repeat domain-containing protein [Bacteroidales bacterium]|jgi:ankyrin repeat protein|nr:ankyrin repeat domain-containing protein [Bacteroidales bacterium]
MDNRHLILAKNKYQAIPYDLAKMDGHNDIAAFLRDAGLHAANPVDLATLLHFEDRASESLHFFAARGNLEEAKRLVEKDPVSVFAQNSYGETPYDWAKGTGHDDIAALLLDVSLRTPKPKDRESEDYSDYEEEESSNEKGNVN